MKATHDTAYEQAPQLDDPAASAQAYLTFHLGEEVFAMPVDPVREILDPCKITRVPASPAHMLGVINVRGSTTAVMDLRIRFGLPGGPLGTKARIIIMEFNQGGERIVVGGLADGVSEVLELTAHDITPAPSLAMRWPSEYVHGVTLHKAHHIILLDIHKLLLNPANT